LTNEEFTWVPTYFLDILRSKDRETVFDHERWVKKAIMAGTMINVFNSRVCETRIYNSGIAIDRRNLFIIKNIEKTDVGYKITCMEPRHNSNNLIVSANWDLITGNGLIDLLFYIDGDYIDMYINNYDSSNKFFSIVRVNNEFIKQFDELIRTNTCDLTNIVWPRRADGSTDYPPPQLAQAVPEQPETVAVNIPPAEYEEAAAVTPVVETVAQQPGIGLPLVIVFAALGIAVVAGVVVFLIRRKK
jgi:hypothetical protein